MTTPVKHTAIVIPTYNNAATVGNVLSDVLVYGLPVIVVNDGSTDETAGILRNYPCKRIISHPRNKGKGAALQSGLKAAEEEGFRYAITLDSDGQHYADDIPLFLSTVEESPDCLLIGARNLASENMPDKNSFANRFSNFWFRLETGVRLDDTQSGFRLYPLEKIKGMRFFTTKYEFELEVIVRAVWRSICVKNIPVRVYYPPEGERVSHFRPGVDFARISLLNSVLVLIALFWYWPWRFFGKLTKENIKKFMADHITHSPESNFRIALAVALGVCMGIVPVWGYQMILTALIAHLLGLNKIIALVASNISIPPMIPFILFGSYAAGGWLLNRPVSLSLHEVTFETLKESFIQYLIGSLLLALISGIIAGVLCLCILSLLRKPASQTS